VDFAEIERFLDTPVKRYSSGMYVRLAFSVAAHLHPEILLIDEVLAVGDVQFQEKCLAKMGDAATHGRTVLFVSHNLGAITALCTRAILIDHGRVAAEGPAREVVTTYLESLRDSDEDVVTLEPASSDAYFEEAAVLDAARNPSRAVPVDSDFYISLQYVVRTALSGIDVDFHVARDGATIFYSDLAGANGAVDHKPGRYRALVPVPAQFLTPGVYSISFEIHRPNVEYFDRHDHVVHFSVLETGSDDYRYLGQDIGTVFVDLPWTVEAIGHHDHPA
jgi:lipopolysaccharide transport system ATP-binding protein